MTERVDLGLGHEFQDRLSKEVVLGQTPSERKGRGELTSGYRPGTSRENAWPCPF